MDDIEAILFSIRFPASERLQVAVKKNLVNY